MKVTFWRWLRLWWRTKWSKHMTSISVGLRNDGTIDVDMAEADADGTEGTWGFNNLDLEEAEFLRDELDEAIKRAKAKSLPKKAVQEPHPFRQPAEDGPRPEA